VLAEGFVGKKEVWFLAGSPSPAIFTERTGWHNAVDMRVVDELTGPGMQYAHDALEGGDGHGSCGGAQPLHLASPASGKEQLGIAVRFPEFAQVDELDLTDDRAYLPHRKHRDLGLVTRRLGKIPDVPVRTIPMRVVELERC
jgi:hypothetical protein